MQRAEQTVLAKLAHFQGVLDGRTFAAQLRCFGATGDRQHFEIKILGQALVQAQLFSAEMPASLEGGEVEETEVHRLLHFISKGAGKHDPGNVGLDDLESIYRMRVEGRILQGGDQGLAHRRSLRVGKNSGRHYGV
ncbi:hypothetical protein D3C73_1357740 [compost metagenome]